MTYPYPSRNRQIAILIAISGVVLVIGIIALNTVMYQNVANVQTVDVEVYWDSNHANKVSLIDWGLIEPGTTKNVTVYILSTGSSNVMLAKNETNWSSSDASKYITLSWDYNGEHIGPGQIRETKLGLTVYPDIQGVTSFSFDLIITAVGQ